MLARGKFFYGTNLRYAAYLLFFPEFDYAKTHQNADFSRQPQRAPSELRRRLNGPDRTSLRLNRVRALLSVPDRVAIDDARRTETCDVDNG